MVMQAYIQRRERKDGALSVQVKWRPGGDRYRPWESETFTDTSKALEFKMAVEVSALQWPPRWIRGAGWEWEQSKPPAPPTTLDDVHAAYMKRELEKITLNRKRPKQVGRDKRTYELHIAPLLGETPITDITREDVRQWVLQMTRANAAPKSVKNRHSVLSSVLNYASVEMGLRPDNPARGVELAKADVNRQLLFFTHGEWAIVRRCIRSDVHDLVDTALATATRWQEVSAIRVGDLSRSPDSDEVVHIHLTRAWVSRDVEYDNDPILWDEGENRKWKLQGLKNRSARWVSVEGELAHRIWAAAAGHGQDEYLFTTRSGTPWRYDDFHTDRWAPAIALAKEHNLTKHGLFHMLRHTGVVWSLADGMKIEVVSVMLGHASIQITMDRYGGLLNLKDAAMAHAMARQMAYAETAILPVNLRQEDVDARKIRPGRRGETRSRRQAS